MTRIALFFILILTAAFATGRFHQQDRSSQSDGLVGYWKLQGDCADHSGNNNNGINHGADLAGGRFDGAGSYIEVPDSPTLDFGTGDFSLFAWVCTEKMVNDVIGDILDKYDPALRRGMTLSVNSSAGGYQSAGTDRHVYFGIDNARGADVWEDCGRPGPSSNYVSNSLTVYRGKLYAAVGNAIDEKDWCHVYRYEGNRKWTDLGRVGDRRTTGVGPMIVHNGDLYVVTTTIDWTRITKGGYEPGRVYRFGGTNNWIDCGQPSENPTLNCIASYRGKLFTGGGPKSWGVFTQHDTSRWVISKIFPKEGPERCFPHSMMVYNNKLYVGYPYVFSYDGKSWAYEGAPAMTESMPQIHSMTVFRGNLCAGSWPGARVSGYSGNQQWQSLGRAGIDGTEVNALAVYNGKLYSGSLPRSELCRYDDKEEWTSLKRFYSPAGWTPVPPAPVGGKPTTADVNEWSRLTSLTVYDGKLYASTGSCTSSPLDAPLDARGKVYSMEAGKMASFDMDLGPGWKQIAAIRRGGVLELYIDGVLVKKTSAFDPSQFDLSNDRPLRIGFGETDYFNGRISEVRMYNRALADPEIKKLFTESKLQIMNYFNFR